ncbi:MAG: hypothetical protein HC913_03270 [Microscillaceae bacterium]|nr:hypothetical protein [Microscillaceae bacterium]
MKKISMDDFTHVESFLPVKEVKDNLRRYWENELIQFTLRPYLKKCLANLPKGQGLRILEIGVGPRDAYRLLTQIPAQASSLDLDVEYVVQPGQISLYLGIDPEYDWVERANEIHRYDKRVRFIRADFERGIGILKQAEAPFDLYFSKFGSLSQLHEDALKRFLIDTCEHARPHSLLFLDFKGEYAVRNHSLEYTKCWSARAIQSLLEEVKAESGVGLKTLKILDRTLLVGYPDEAEQPKALNMRKAVNRLLQKDVRTDLKSLLVPPHFGQALAKQSVREFFHYLGTCWNILVQYAEHRLQCETPPQHVASWEQMPPSLQFGLLTLDRIIRDTQWMAYGDRRANLIEPHLAYALRSLEYELQVGLGCGEDLCVVLEVQA